MDINHPLVKWIVSTIKAENLFVSSCSAIQISKRDLPDSIHIPNGNYTFYIQQWTADGARKLNELHFFLCGVNDAVPVNPALAENLLTIAALQGDSFDTNFLDDADFELAVDAVNRLIGHAWSEFGEFEILHREQNDDLIKNQEQYLRRTTEKKIAGFRAIIADLQMKQKDQRVIRMWEGRIKRATEVMEEQIRRLNSKFNCPITCGDVAVGILVIKE